MPSLGDLFVTVGAKIDGFKAAMTDVSTTVTQTASTASTAANKISSVFSVALGAGVSALALGAANKFDSAFAQIQRSTGATEEKMKSLQASFTNVYRQTAASSEAVATTLALLSTRTQATGKDLEDLTLKTIKLAKTQNEDVTQVVPLVTRAFGDWSIAARDQGRAMDYLRVASQQTGTQVSRLAEQVVYAGAPLRALGYDFNQAVALIAKFEKEGVNTELVLGGMKAALQKFTKEGVTDTAAAWQSFVAGVQKGSITFKQVAEEVGAKRAVDLFKAIQEGRFQIDGMVASLKDLETKGGASIETMRTRVTKWTHEVESLVAAHKDLVIALGLAVPALVNIGGILGGIVRSVAVMGPALAAVLSNPLVLAALTMGTGAAIGLTQLASQTSGLHSLDDAYNKWLSDQVSGAKTAEDLAKAQEHVNKAFAEGLLSKVETAKALDVIREMQNKLAGQSMTSFLHGQGLTVDTSALKKPAGGNGFDEEQVKKDFSALGIRDLEVELDGATKAFGELTAAHKLNDGQVIAATQHLVDLRAQIAELRAGVKDQPKATEDLLKTLGVDSSASATAQLRNMAEALSQLRERIAGFIGPQEQAGQLQREYVQGLENYAHALGVADTAEKERITTGMRLVETEADLNQAAKENNDLVRDLPAVYHALTDPLANLWGNITGVTDAFHYFNVQTPYELQQTADMARKQYEIMRDSGMASAAALNEAFTRFKLAQIELDHQRGITDDALYAQQKKNAEDALKTIEGGTARTVKQVRSIGDELSRDWESATQTMERNAAHAVLVWKGGFDVIKQYGQSLAEDLLASFMKGLFSPLEDELKKIGKKIGDVFGGIWGKSGGGGTAPSIPGGGGGGSAPGGGSAGGASGIGGALGAIGAISSAVSAVTGVIGVFQSMHQETSLNAIEHNTRYTEIIQEEFKRDSWDQYYGLLRKLDDIWSSIRSGSRGGGGDASTLGSIRDYTRLTVAKFDEFVIPKMDVMIAQMSGGLAGGGSITVNFNAPISGVTDDLIDELGQKIVRSVRAKQGSRNF